MKKPIYNAAPLPFMGQKRRFLGEFRKALATLSPMPGCSSICSAVPACCRIPSSRSAPMRW